MANPNPVSTPVAFDETAPASDEIHEGLHPSREITPQLVKQFLGYFNNSRVFMTPDIPIKKLKNAVTAYGCGVSQSSVLLLYDDTWSGGARNGLMITKNSVCWKNKFGTANRVYFSNIEKVSHFEGSSLKAAGVEVNGIRAVTNSCDDKAIVARTFAHLLEYMTGRKVTEFCSDSFYSDSSEFFYQNHVTLFGHRNGVSSVAFSSDGTSIASGSRDKTIKLWNTTSGKEINTLKGHADEVLGVAFTLDGSRIASASLDKSLKLWDVASGNEIRTFKGIQYSSDSNCVAFGPDGTRSAYEDLDGMIKVLDIASGLEITTLKPSFWAGSVAFSSDGTRIAWGSHSGGELKVWDAFSGKEITTLKGRLGAIYSITFSPDDKWIATGSSMKTIALWDVASGQEVKTFKGHTEAISCVAFSPDGAQIVSGSGDNTLRLWDVASGQEITAFKAHPSGINSVAFSPDGRHIASGSADSTVKLWRLRQRSGPG